MDLTGEGRADGAALATSILIMESTASIFAAFCPSWFTVRSDFFHDQGSRPGNVASIRQGELAATILSVGTGIAATYLTRSPLPVLGASLMSAIMVIGYEFSISHPAAMTGQAEEDDARPVSSRTLWRSA